MQLFHHTSNGRFLLLPLESGKIKTSGLPITSGASPVAFGNQKEQFFFLIFNFLIVCWVLHENLSLHVE
jgi:hypothetical protein